MDVPARRGSDRSPVPAIAFSIAAGLTAAIAFVVGPASGGAEPTITGSVLIAFAIGWALMSVLTRRFSAQPQPWTLVPAAFLGIVGISLVATQPGARAMDVLGWLWPFALFGVAIWSFIQMRRGLAGRARWLLHPVLAVLVLLAVGGGIETIAEAADRAAHPMPGRLIAVNGHQMHIECVGSGGLTVVLQSGAGESSIYWDRIMTTVSTSTRVCAYDRPGRGWSDPTTPEDGATVAAELHTLLRAAGEHGPYVLVGHSSGGLYVRIFAAAYPSETAGLALLDSQPATAFTSLPDYPMIYTGIRTVTSVGTPLARLGLTRLLYLSEFTGLPANAQSAQRANQSSAMLASSSRDEFAELATTITEALSTPSLGSTPLAVVTALSEAQCGWLEAQNELATLSTNSRHVVIADISHGDLIETERGAAASSEAILAVIAAVQTGTPMGGR